MDHLGEFGREGYLTLIHASDLHLSEVELDYCLAVLDELVDLCCDVQASFLLLAGDVFDSFNAAEAMRGPFRARIGRLNNACRVLLLPGNHDEQRQGNRRLGALDLGPVMLLDRRPFSLVRFEADALEVVAIPEQRDYDGFRSWGVPAKAAPVRIVLAHGTVPGMAYTGPAATEDDDEGATGLFDPRLFHELQADYVALGHLHGHRQAVEDRITLSYPGSARVYRRGESGERGVWRVNVGMTGVASEFVVLRASGQYRPYEVPVDLAGTIDLAPLHPEAWNRNDWVTIQATGVVEDENALPLAVSTLRRRYASMVRRFEIEADGCEAMPGIASQPLAKRFLEAWEANEPQEAAERPAWLRARQLGLLAIKQELQAGR